MEPEEGCAVRPRKFVLEPRDLGQAERCPGSLHFFPLNLSYGSAVFLAASSFKPSRRKVYTPMTQTGDLDLSRIPQYPRIVHVEGYRARQPRKPTELDRLLLKLTNPRRRLKL